jgi:hypothetical protein
MQSAKHDPEPSPEKDISRDSADPDSQPQNADEIGRRAQELIEELHDRDPQKTTVIRGPNRIGGT